ncbi:hypothetical protein T11_2070 [Trichinella zimbabwensis]|uniref:Uncharacterized protein n=1 Tax=Trichinella zimbabwensis TaxID=268475 RepID=A0A0V1HDM9_9BILA|nr:hypothetical protein T11_8353 [Trichinella zimbabwensis]KRZ08830.1 hypothetical protein T11_2070 [Trichinella zimbabwensis]
MTNGHRTVFLWQEYVDVILSKLAALSVANPGIIVHDTMVQSSEKANLEEFNSLPCRCSSSHGSSGLFFFTVPTKVKFFFLSSTPSPLPCREPLACLGSSREFHLTACQCRFAYSMRSLTLSNRLPKT